MQLHPGRSSRSRRGDRPGQGHFSQASQAPNSISGFTLIELMIALVLLGVGVLGTAQVFAVANRHTSAAREETAAACLAQEIREKIMSESFADIYSIFDNIDTDVPATVPVTAETWANHVAAELGPHGRGTVQVNTPATDATIPNGMVEVTVTISFPEGGQTVGLPLRFNVAKTSP